MANCSTCIYKNACGGCSYGRPCNGYKTAAQKRKEEQAEKDSGYNATVRKSGYTLP